MAIYRGAGGAGDATADASSEASLIKDLAVEVQADADAAAASAAAAAASASAASASASAAATAETNAETAETNAETAEANAETAQAAAEAAQAAAEAAQTAAETAETNAETAETNAETAATNASSSASAASTSATNAASSASSASTSATNASNSASAAATSATNASNSATAASTSATNAANSATAAQTAETNAETAETNAETAQAAAEAAQLAAETAQTAAELAETNAETAETNAETAATNASNSASAASTSATNASNSATAAATSASAADTSAVAAAASAASAAASYDNFDDRYLGAKTSDPTLDNDGNALVTGALYYNTTDGVMKVYDGGVWISASASSQAILVVYQYTATAAQTTFTGSDDNSLTLDYTVGSVLVTLNGVMLEVGSEVTATTGTSVVLASAATAGDELNVYAFATFELADVYTKSASDALYPLKSNNLDDLASASSARTNLGLGTLATVSPTGTASSSTYLRGDSSWASIASSQWTTTGSDIYYNTGNVGIGITSPNTELHVQGAPTTDGSIVFNEQLTATTAFNASPQSGTMVSLKYNTGGDYAGLGGWSVIKENATDGNFASAMLFHTRANGGAITERARITSGGDFRFNSGYGSVATAYGCRAWVNFNGTGTVSIRGSGNVSSITDNGTGRYTVNFSTAMVDTVYSVVGSAKTADDNSTGNNNIILCPYSFSTGSVSINTTNGGATLNDTAITNVQIVR